MRTSEKYENNSLSLPTHIDMNDEALSFFEQARSLSKSSNSADIEMRAARNVVGVRIKMAEKVRNMYKSSLNHPPS